jgi:predicted nucleic acid-binding protein
VKVFLDTNVLVSGFVTRGLCADVIRLALAEHELIVAQVVLAELKRVLKQKIELPAE